MRIWRSVFSNLVDVAWSEYDLKTFVCTSPRVSVGQAKAWDFAETRGTALNLTLKYTPPGERRWTKPWVFHNPPKAWWRRWLWHECFLASETLQYVLQETEAQGPANTDQLHIWFEQANTALNDVLQAHHAQS